MRLCAILLLTALGLAAEQFPPADVKIVGDIDFGQTSNPIECTSSQPYCAVLFNGAGGDKLEITIKGTSGRAFVALTDGSLTEMARGTDRLAFVLPKSNEELQTYYIVFRDLAKKDGKFTITLSKPGAPGSK